MTAEEQEIEWGEKPVILAFDNGMTVVTYIAFTAKDVVLMKNPYLISRTFDGNMVIVKYLPESSTEIFTIATSKILTVGVVCKEVLKTYMNVLFGKSENEVIH